MRGRHWPLFLTRRTPRQLDEAPDESAWQAVAAAIVATLLAIGAGCGLWLQFEAAGAVPSVDAAARPAGLVQALLYGRGAALQQLWSNVSYPALAITVGYALASASHSRQGPGDRLVRLFRSRRDAAHDAPPPREVLKWIGQVSALSRQVDATRSELHDVLKSAWQLARLEPAAAPGRSEDGEAALPRRIGALFGFRRLVAVLETETAETGVSNARLCLQFVSDGERAEFLAAPLALRLHVFGRGVEVVRSHADVELPPSGPSQEVRITLGRIEPQARLRVLVTQPGDADVLQQHEIPLVLPS